MERDASAPRRIGTALVISGLLAAATIFFVWGALAERSHHQDSPGATATHQEGGSSESADQRAAEGGSGETGSTSEFQPLGINLESDPLIIVAALGSLSLAGLVAFRTNRAVLAAVVVVGVAFTALEIVEVLHQADVDETGLLVLAATAGVLHAGAAFLAARELFASSRTAPAST